MKLPLVLGSAFAFAIAPLTATSAWAEEGGVEPRVFEERHGLESLPVILVICALIIAVGLAYGIGRRSRK
jgi:hypothetical protein